MKQRAEEMLQCDDELHQTIKIYRSKESVTLELINTTVFSNQPWGPINNWREMFGKEFVIFEDFAHI